MKTHLLFSSSEKARLTVIALLYQMGISRSGITDKYGKGEKYGSKKYAALFPCIHHSLFCFFG